MKHIGLDLSLTCTGLAWYEPESGDYETSDLDIKKRKAPSSGLKRLDWIRGQVREFLQDQQASGLITVATEGYSFGSAGSQSHKAGELGGIVRMLCYDMGLPLVVVPPQTLKQFVTGSGGGGKDVIMLNAYKRWGVDIQQNDQCDAYCLARYGALYWTTHPDRRTHLPSFQVQALSKGETLNERPRTRIAPPPPPSYKGAPTRTRERTTEGPRETTPPPRPPARKS